ncbi:hypothetical protein BC937DRAFT_93871 [Endogone sp. FLAS-F59071]|nr:hypothetical protein BC937DRAFT_93871 [Endogone sp. FLAS-F59071]|eukprot:RUS14410.1 hypothetical protein BC937DRAFT_93871 [Endogone sp. FLAS-F59071]
MIGNSFRTASRDEAIILFWQVWVISLSGLAKLWGTSKRNRSILLTNDAILHEVEYVNYGIMRVQMAYPAQVSVAYLEPGMFRESETPSAVIGETFDSMVTVPLFNIRSINQVNQWSDTTLREKVLKRVIP